MPFRAVIGVFDIVTTNAPSTREFLKVSQEEGFIQAAEDKVHAKSFIVANNKIYYSPIACATLRKRWMSLYLNIDDASRE